MAEIDEFIAFESLTNSYEEIIVMYFQDSPLNYQLIQQKIEFCSINMDRLISLNTNEEFMVKLVHLKQELLLIKEAIATQLNSIKQVPNVRNFVPNQKQPDYNPTPEIVNSIVEIPRVKGFDDIVGLLDIKRTFKSLVILPKTQPQLFVNRPVCNTILLYGPPGTGKTHLAHALASEAAINLHCLSAGDLLSRYVGDTEKTIKQLFQFMRNNSDFMLLFIDEIDGLCRKRFDSEQEYSRRIKTELMCQLSNIENHRNLFVICATNCPWDLDAAILRRLQKRIYVPLPSRVERLQYLQKAMINENFNVPSLEQWEPLLDKTEGYSISDLVNVVRNAQNGPLNELEDTRIWKENEDGTYEAATDDDIFSTIICSSLQDLPSNSVKARKLNMADLITASNSVVKTVTSEHVAKYELFNKL